MRVVEPETWPDKMLGADMQPDTHGPSPSLAWAGAPSPGAIPLTASGLPAPLTALLLSPDLCLSRASQGSPVCWAPSGPWEAATGALPLPGREHRVQLSSLQ